MFHKSIANALVMAKKDFADEALSRHLPFATIISDSVIMLRDGDLMASLIVEGVNADTTDSSDLKIMAQTLKNMIGQLGEGFGWYINKITRPAGDELHDIGGNGFAAEVDRRWKSYLSSRGLLRRALVVSLIIRPTIGRRIPFLGRAMRLAFQEDLESRKARLEEGMEFLKGALRAAHARRLTIETGEWLGLLAATIGQETGHIQKLDTQFIASYLTDFDILFKEKEYEIETQRGRRHGAVISLKTYPVSTWPTMLDALDLPFEISIASSFTPIRNNVIEERIRRVARQMRATEDAAITLQEGLVEAADNVASGFQTFGDHSMSITVTTDSSEELEEAIAEVRRVGQQVGAVMVRETGTRARAAFFAQAPGNFAYRARRAPISADNFCELTALHACAPGLAGDDVPWGTPITILPTTRASGYRFNFHRRGKSDAEPSAGHSIILGNTGSGKTFLASFLMAQSRRANPRIIVFDKDRGLEMAVRALGGRYSAVRIGQPTGFNPLRTETDARGEAWLIDWLTAQLEKRGDLSTPQAISIQDAVRQIANAPENLRTFDHLPQLFGATEDKLDLRARSEEWSSSGRYGWLFTDALGDTEAINLDENLVGIDMSEILDLETERSALLGYLFRRIERIVEDGQPTMIVIDEAWKLLDDEYFVKKLQDWLVTMRKKNVAVIMLTQTPRQFEDSRVGQILVEMSTTHILFPNPRAKPEDYKLLRLNEKEGEFLTETLLERLALVRSGDTSVVVDVNMAALGMAVTVLGGGNTGVEAAPENWRQNPEFWKEMI